MDITIQKAVELGVNSIQPLITTRCGVKVIKSIRRARSITSCWGKHQTYRQLVFLLHIHKFSVYLKY